MIAPSPSPFPSVVACESCFRLATPAAVAAGPSWQMPKGWNRDRAAMSDHLGIVLPTALTGVGICDRCGLRRNFDLVGLGIAALLALSIFERLIGSATGWEWVVRVLLIVVAVYVLGMGLISRVLGWSTDTHRRLTVRARLRRHMSSHPITVWPPLDAQYVEHTQVERPEPKLF